MSAGFSIRSVCRTAVASSVVAAAALTCAVAPTTALAHDHRGMHAMHATHQHHPHHPHAHPHHVTQGAVVVQAPYMAPQPAVVVTPVEPVHRVHRHGPPPQVFCLSGYTLLPAHQGCPIGTVPVAVTPLR